MPYSLGRAKRVAPTTVSRNRTDKNQVRTDKNQNHTDNRSEDRTGKR